MRTPRAILNSIILMLFVAGGGYAATITGTVKGPDGSAFEGAFVQAQNAMNGITVYVLSGKDGRYRIENLPTGEYELRIRAIGYRGQPRSGITLSGNQTASFDFPLQKGIVRWSDLSVYQGSQLLPEGPGKELLVDRCFGCHGFESRMASVRRDENGWREKVNFMRDTVGVHVNDHDAAEIASYLTSVFGEDSKVPESPALLPAYKSVEQKFSDDSTKIVYVEYEMPGPGRMPWDANPDKNGNIWIPYFSQVNALGKLDPKTGDVQEFKLPNEPRVAMHSAFPAPDGTVWFTEQSNNRIGKWDPATGKITEIQDTYVPPKVKVVHLEGGEGIPSSGSKHTIRVDPQGIVWTSGMPFTRFDPRTQEFTEFKTPPNTYGNEIDNDGNIWFTGWSADGKIYKIDTKTGKMMSWQPPTAGWPRRITIDSNGIVYFTEYAAGKIGRLDPSTGAFKEYQLPGGQPTPYGVVANQYGVWYSSEKMDVIGRVDPDTGKITLYPFSHFENTIRELRLDTQGRIWYGTPANNKVGYFYLASK